MKWFLGLILTSSLFISTQANAALLIEPVLGYNLGVKADFKDNDDLSYEGESYSGGTGPAFGGRLGYQNLGFQLGLDYLHSSVDLDSDFKNNVAIDEWAAFVGFKFPILLRVYAGYIFSATADTKAKDGGEKIELKSGSGMKAGVGFTLLPFLDINLEYRRGSFDEWKLGGTTIDSKVDYSAFMLGVSLPFTI